MQQNQEVFSQVVQASHDEAQLIEQFQRGDKSVFNQLVIRYQGRVYGLALRYVRNPEEALDLTQDAFLRAYIGLSDFKTGRPFYAWLHRITTNLCIDFCRRNARRKGLTYESESLDYLMLDLADGRPSSPSQHVENQELKIAS